MILVTQYGPPWECNAAPTQPSSAIPNCVTEMNTEDNTPHGAYFFNLLSSEAREGKGATHNENGGFWYTYLVENVP